MGSDESDDDSSDPGSAQQGNDHQLIQNNLFETETGGSKAASFFDLPTQYSSEDSMSSEDGKGEDSNVQSKNDPSDQGPSTIDHSLPQQSVTRGIATHGSSMGLSLTDQCLVDSPESKHVHFKANSVGKTSAAEELTDTPMKPLLPVNGTNKSGANARMSLDSLTDTPLQCQKSVRQPRKSLDSLTDTPLQCRKNTGQQRKRLRPAYIDKSNSKKLEARSADKVQRKDRVKKRIEDKYKCRFLDCEAVNDGSEESDEESDIKRIEDGEMSQ